MGPIDAGPYALIPMEIVFASVLRMEYDIGLICPITQTLELDFWLTSWKALALLNHAIPIH